MKRLFTGLLLPLLLISTLFCRKEKESSGPPDPGHPYYLMYKEGSQWVYHQRDEEKICRTAAGYCAVLPFDTDELYLYIHLDPKLPLAHLHQLKGVQFDYNEDSDNVVWWYLSDPSKSIADSIAGSFLINDIDELDSTTEEISRIISGTFRVERYSDNFQMHNWENGRFRFRVYE